jgi:predicted lysophospholipase L1 biosynthesis ABC-type transport system permease subunit
VLPFTGVTPELAAGLSRVGTLLGVAAVVVFFIACVNVALLMLARAFARSRETALRIALGASFGQLARELLSDSVVVAFAGGVSGMVLAVWMSRILPALLYEKDAEQLGFAPELFGIVAVSTICIGITIVCGLLPVFVISHDRPATVLRLEVAGPSHTIRRLRLGLVMAQLACCCLLVIGTAVLLEGLRAALVNTAGHRLDHALLATVQADPTIAVRYFRDVEEATKSTAGVSRITWAEWLAGGEPTWRSFHVDPELIPLHEVTLAPSVPIHRK